MFVIDLFNIKRVNMQRSIINTEFIRELLALVPYMILILLPGY